MKHPIPTPPLMLGLLGLVPFFLAAFAPFIPFLDDLFKSLVGMPPQRFMFFYGIVIFCFMGGTLWGFAARYDDSGPFPYVLSVVPSFWAILIFLMPVSSRITLLILGFIGLLFFDWFFRRNGLAPRWWLRLRIMLTAGVVLCLFIRQFTFVFLSLLGN